MRHPAPTTSEPQGERKATEPPSTLITVRSGPEVGRLRALLRDYAASLDIDLAFQGFEAELAGLPGAYVAPAGAAFLAQDASGQDIGCVCVRPLDVTGACEIKRLYVRQAGRGSGAGRLLARAAVSFAEAAGYREVRLDTFPSMVAAITIYRELGFEEIAPYRDTGGQDLLFFGRRLRAD